MRARLLNCTTDSSWFELPQYLHGQVLLNVEHSEEYTHFGYLYTWRDCEGINWYFKEEWLEFLDEKENRGENNKMESNKFYMPDKVTFSNPATVVFWDDKTKTVIKTFPFDKEKGLSLAFVEKHNPQLKQLFKVSNTQRIYIWQDGQVSAVGLHDEDDDDEKAFAMAYMRKVMTRNQFEKMIKKYSKAEESSQG